MRASIVTIKCGGEGPSFSREPEATFIQFNNEGNLYSPCELYQEALAGATLVIPNRDVLCYIHDDVAIHDTEWEYRVAGLFLDNPQCVAVGLGGATSLGRPNLYKTPYNIWNMARGGYASNQKDAEVHGERFSGIRRVAVLDAFFMAVRTDFLSSVGGWPVDSLTHHCLDLWLACEAARHNKEIWMVGCECNHYGGGSSTKPAYAKAQWLQGGTLESDHTTPHKWLYENYRDVLPIEVK